MKLYLTKFVDVWNFLQYFETFIKIGFKVQMCNAQDRLPP